MQRIKFILSPQNNNGTQQKEKERSKTGNQQIEDGDQESGNGQPTLCKFNHL
jgi:hypothetical protein